MFKPKDYSQIEYEFVSINALVLDNYKFRKKKLSEASHTQKSCTGFATVGYGD
jgi:hypothetical protein